MAGALMQLVAYGAQDVYLTAEPTITFWKAVYRRHTNFAMESMEQTFSGTANFGNRAVCRVSRNGDLMSSCFVRVQLPTTNTQTNDNWVNRVGFRLLKQVELRVGGQMIDRHYSTWMHIWTELTHTFDKKRLLDKMVGPYSTVGSSILSSALDAGNLQLDTVALGQQFILNRMEQATTGTSFQPSPANGLGLGALTLNIPLLFSFCRHPGLALPLIALQYHEVEIQIDFETLANCTATANDAPTGNYTLLSANANVALWVDYIFLDTEERKEFAQKPHEYLIETTQTQVSTISSGSNSVRLTFNHPTKFLAWCVRPGIQTDFTGAGAGGEAFTDTFTGFTDNNLNPFVNKVKLQLNGQDRFNERTEEYFNQVQAYQYFTGIPQAGIYVYSFALKPEEHQPSGSCNLSRIDNVNLNISTNANMPASGSAELNVFAFSYNVFRVASGMGGLAYSN
jgi:hypothetical protein